MDREQLIDELFAQAAELSSAERERFFAEHEAQSRSTDDGVINEVRALLTNYRQATSKEFLKRPLVGGESSEFQTLTDGQEFEGYRIVKLIAEGGMGEVYLAEDEELKRKVAIKLVKGHATKDIMRRFHSERQILANLKHPHIAQLYEAGATTDGLPFFVMEYVEGQPIDQHVRDADVRLDDRLKLFRTVCSAVSYAHQNLIIHRDIKPGNILVTNDGAPKLLDFGIAKLLHEDAESADATQTMFRALTPQYASPEQVKGEPVTTASDVYSLGVLLYELLTGQRPYKLKRQTAEEITKAICEQEPTKPSAARGNQESGVGSPGANQKSQIKNLKSLKGDLDNIVLKALRKEPERRYASVEQFSEDIRRHLEGLPVTAHPDSIKYRASKFVQRNKIGVAAAAIILLTLVGGILATAWQARKARAESARAQQRFNQVRKLAHSVLFDYHDEIAALPGSTQARQKLVKDSLEYLDSLASEASNDISLQREIGTAYQRIGEIQGGNITSSRGGTITFANLGDTQGALGSFRKALAIRERLAALQPTNTDIQQEWGTNITRMGEVSLTLGKPTDALNYFQKATEIYDKLLAADPTNEVLRAKGGSLPFTVARALGIPGGANLGRGPEALLNIRKALAIYEALAAEHPTQSRYRVGVEALHGNIGRVLFIEGKAQEAMGEYRQSQAIAETLVKENNTNAFYRSQLAITYGSMGSVLLSLGKKAEALESCRQSVSILESLVAADPNDATGRTDLANNYRNMAEVFAANNDAAGAMTSFDKAVQTLTELTAKNPSNALISYSQSLAFLKRSAFMLDSGKVTESLGNALEVVKISEALIAIDPTNASARSSLAAAYYQLGRCAAKSATSPKGSAREQMDNWREAKDWYQKSATIYQDMKSQGTLSGADANKADELAKEIAKCEAALARSQPR